MADLSRSGGLDDGAGAPSRARVLLVEGPSAPLTQIRSRHLRGLGVEVILEPGPARAIERLEADGDFAVIVCEEDLAGASGLDLLDAMRSISPTTARVLVAGSTSPEAPRVQDVVFRRVSPLAPPSELAAAIHDAIDYHQLLATSPVQPVEPGRAARDAIPPPAHPARRSTRRERWPELGLTTDAVVIDVPEAAPELVVLDPGASRVGLRVVGRVVELLPGATVVGRSRTCHIPIPDPHVSRRHATFSHDASGISVRNISSTNRLRVNGVRVERDAACALKVGDRVTLGSHEIEVCALGDYCPSFEPTQNTAVRAESAVDGDHPSTLATLAQVAEKCFAFGHVREAERISRPLLEGLRRHCESGARPGPGDVDLATGLSLRIAESNRAGEWVNYLFQLYTAIEEPMAAEVIERLYRLVPESAGISMSSFRRYLAALVRVADRHGPRERFLLRRLQGLEAPLMMSAHL